MTRLSLYSQCCCKDNKKMRSINNQNYFYVKNSVIQNTEIQFLGRDR